LGITASATWSLAKLRDHLLERGTVTAISRETPRRILRAGGVPWQTTTTWKTSTDPGLHRQDAPRPRPRRPPTHRRRVVCVDEPPNRNHKRHREFLGLLKTLRTRWPDEKLYVMVDNFSPHSHGTHTEQNTAIDSYIRWHNAHAQPKTGFATDSPRRTWTHYPTKVA
jgi:hypothetical protein